MDLQEKSGQSEMLHLVLKENQDIEQSYLKTASEFLKTDLSNDYAEFNSEKN